MVFVLGGLENLMGRCICVFTCHRMYSFRGISWRTGKEAEHPHTWSPFLMQNQSNNLHPLLENYFCDRSYHNIWEHYI